MGMPRSSTATMDEILERVEALEEEVRELRESPRERLRVAVERMRERMKHVPERKLNKAIDSALRESRRERASRQGR